MKSVLGFYTFVCQLFQLQAKVLQLFFQFRQAFWRRTCFSSLSFYFYLVKYLVNVPQDGVRFRLFLLLFIVVHLVRV